LTDFRMEQAWPLLSKFLGFFFMGICKIEAIKNRVSAQTEVTVLTHLHILLGGGGPSREHTQSRGTFPFFRGHLNTHKGTQIWEPIRVIVYTRCIGVFVNKLMEKSI